MRPSPLAVLAALASSSCALGVSPGSPCASSCAGPSDGSAVVVSNSTSIACTDEGFRSQPRYQRCIRCLQNSTYSSGGQTDQGWFLYHLRFAFDTCVLGFPNATGLGPSPCRTSLACGPLDEALDAGLVPPEPLRPYAYCGPSGSAFSDPALDGCLQCVQAQPQSSYLSNFLIALQAACQQQPSPGVLVGLNGTVFSSSPVAIVQPRSARSSGSSLSSGHIVVVSIGALVASLLVAACTYMQLRRRRHRAARGRRARTSLLVQRHMETLPGARPPVPLAVAGGPSQAWQTRPVLDPSAALGSNPVRGGRFSHDAAVPVPPPPVLARGSHRCPGSPSTADSQMSYGATSHPPAAQQHRLWPLRQQSLAREP